MDIKETIQRYVGINGGSEKRVKANVVQDCKCKEEVVEANIKWMIKRKYLDVIVNRCDMNDDQKRYYDSDSCRILINLKEYNEIKYLEEKRKREEEINKLPNKDKFIKLFKEMEDEFDFNNFYNYKNYTYETTNDYAAIKNIDENETIRIDFANTSNWTYNEAENNIFYKKENSYYVIELYYLWGKCNVKHYKSL